MLTRTLFAASRERCPGKQKGVVMIIALIVLVAMTLAAVALVRSVDTGNIIAGNLSFQQAAMHSADTGVEAAIAWLEQSKTGITLQSDDPTHGYSAAGTKQNPAPGTSWDSFWTQSLDGRSVCVRGARGPNGMSDCDPDPNTGNKVAYVIDRMCQDAGPSTGGTACTRSIVTSPDDGNGEEGGEVPPNAPSVVYYRITVRVAGPRNTVSYVQSMVSM